MSVVASEPEVVDLVEVKLRELALGEIEKLVAAHLRHPGFE
jgi:hypothetical protein